MKCFALNVCKKGNLVTVQIYSALQQIAKYDFKVLILLLFLLQSETTS